MTAEITNQVGVTAYGHPPAYVEGQVLGVPHGYPRAYPLRRNAWTLTFSGDIGAGTVGATWTDELGFEITVEVEIVSDGGSGWEIDGAAVVDASDVADAWVAALLEHADSGSRVHSASNDAGVVTIYGATAGRSYTLDGETSLTPVAQVIEVTVAGSDDGLYRLAITVGDDAPANANHTATGETPEQIRDALETAADALALDIVITPSSTNKLLIESANAGVPISIALTSPSADLTQTTTVENVSLELDAAETVVPNGGDIPFGRALVLATIDGTLGVRQVESGDTAGMIAGFVGRYQHETRDTPTLVDDVPALRAGSTITPVERVSSSICLRNAGNTDAAAGGLVYVVINDAGGDTLGTCRADADGGNAVTPTLFRARWLKATAAGALGLATLT